MIWRNNNNYNNNNNNIKSNNNINYSNALNQSNLDFNYNNLANLNNINFNNNNNNNSNMSLNFKGNPINNNNNNNFYNQFLPKKFISSQDQSCNQINNCIINNPNESDIAELKAQIKPTVESDKLISNKENKQEIAKENTNKTAKKSSSDENLTGINLNSNKNSDNKVNNEFNNSIEFDTDFGSNTIKVDTIENQEASPIVNTSKDEEKTNNANTQESGSSKILIKDLINYNVTF